jgi:hypothetical protein
MTGLTLTPGDPPLTLDEVATHYRMTVRQLRQVVRERSVEVLRIGHTVRFDAHALNSLEEKLRCHANQRDSESSGAPTPAVSRSRGRSRGSAYDNALRATILVSRRKKPPRSKPTSSDPNGTDRVVALAPSPRR